MQVNPYLMFNGQCEAAFKFYETCLDGKITDMMRYSESPEPEMVAQMPPDWQNKVMHAGIRIGDQELMGSDNPPGYEDTPQGFSVSLNLDDPTKAAQIFQALSDRGTVKMPLQKTFWAAQFGMVVDQFGIPWMINCEQAA